MISSIESENFKVLIVGGFKNGKSTFINAMPGKSVLPEDVPEYVELPYRKAAIHFPLEIRSVFL